ncbi:hypothetical protein AQUCO_09100024v1 [Aquilegia coerulea]|uniref:EamA domain-containing protein n=1 Tax=Aquilegia coerulea TaxID=218851 RepID=A0A2G5C5K4_AQUCA|nr:hypothetical protein AQUCO_09100024v1 [Aquilegia coerulea]
MASLSSCSIFYPSLIRRKHRRISHITKFSLDQNQNQKQKNLSSSSSSSDFQTKEQIVLKKKLIHEGRTINSDVSVILKDENFLNTEQAIVKGTKNEIRFNGKKSFFSKKPLWRRILFASRKVKGIILLNVIALVYASNIPVLKEVEAVTDPAVFTVVRFVTSAIPFIPFIIRARDDVQTRSAGLELGVWVSLGYLMQAIGLLTSDAGRASFISLFTVIIVPLLDGLLGAKIPVHTWFGVTMSVLGVAMLESSGSPPCVGDLWNFFSAVFFGIHMLRTEHISRSTKKENFFALLGYEVCIVAIFSIIWYLIGGCFSSDPGWDPGSWTWTLSWDWIVEFPWIPALYTGIFSTGLCLWAEMAAMRDVSATETAIIYGLEPLWGAGFAWFLLGERWGIIGWIGASLVLGGSLTVQIFGSLSPSKYTEEESSSGQDDPLLTSKKRNALSASPIVVSSGKNIQDMFNKK